MWQWVLEDRVEHSSRTGNKSSLLFSSVAAGCRVFCSIHCKNQTSHFEAEANYLERCEQSTNCHSPMVSLSICVPYLCWQWFSMLHCVVFLALISLSHRCWGGFLCRSPLIISAFKLLCKLLSSFCEQCLMGLWFPTLPFLTWRNAFQSWFSIPAIGK